MARTKKQEPKQEGVAVTRAEKKDATKNLIKEVLAIQPIKHNDLLDEVAKLYTQRHGADTDNVNDVKGRVGSVLDIMKKDGEVAYEGGMYALKARLPMPEPTQSPEEKPVKKTAKKSVKKTEKDETPEVKAEEIPAKKASKKSTKKTEKEAVKVTRLTPPTTVEEEQAKKAKPLPAPPIQPIAPVVPTTPEVAPEPLPEKTEKGKRASKKKAEKPMETAVEKPAKKTSKKTTKKTDEKSEEKTEVTTEETPVEVNGETQGEIKAEIKSEPTPETTNEPKAEVMDMSFLFGTVKPTKTEQKEEQKPEAKAEEKAVEAPSKTEEKSAQPTLKSEVKAEQKPMQKPQAQAQSKPQIQPQNQVQSRVLKTVKQAVQKPMSAEEKLRDNFLKKLRSLGGDYFEYYSVYLLEKYSRKNGRRLEGLKISGGERDGGIDGEIELTDRLGFRETIYIQSKNWDPQRGDERLWVVGETLLQQFIGACACKQAKDGKQHTRGIFITTSNFTPDAKRILDTMSDKVVGYDGNDVFDAAKECQFGLIYENGNWKLDEKLLSGTKAFFNMI